MTPTGNVKILHSIHLLGLTTQKTTSAHLTLQKRLERPAVSAFLHADTVHSTYSTRCNSCWWNKHFKKPRGTTRTTASKTVPTWTPGQNSPVLHYVLSYLAALWKTVLPLTGSPKCRGSMALSYIHFDVYIWIEKQWDITECCSELSVASWCLFALKRLFGNQRNSRKTCKDFSPDLCMYGGSILSKNSAFESSDIFSHKIFFNFYQNRKVVSAPPK